MRVPRAGETRLWSSHFAGREKASPLGQATAWKPLFPGAALGLGPISTGYQHPRQREARWPLASDSGLQASPRLSLHTLIKDREVRPRSPAEHRAVSQARAPGDFFFFLRAGGRRLGEPAPATCLVSSPAACAAAASKFLCLPPESAVWIDPPRAVFPGLPGSGSPGARVRGAAGERRGRGEHQEGAAAGDSPGDPLRRDRAR